MKFIYVVYHTRISYRTHMVHTVCVYSYGMTVRVWYGYLYHMRIATIATITVYKQRIAIANTVLLVTNNTHGATFCSDVFARTHDSDKLVISTEKDNSHLACSKSHFELE